LSLENLSYELKQRQTHFDIFATTRVFEITDYSLTCNGTHKMVLITGRSSIYLHIHNTK